MHGREGRRGRGKGGRRTEGDNGGEGRKKGREAQCVITLTFTTQYHVLVHVARF